MQQNYPNPFNPETTIHFTAPKAGHVRLAIYNLLGQEVAVLLNEHQAAGRYSVQFNASGLAGGVYIYRLSTNGFEQSKKMMLLK